MKSVRPGAVLYLMASLLALLLISPGQACDHEDRIPNWQVVGCYACHEWQHMPGLLQFGADYVAVGHAWSAQLAELDSDGDGWSNGVELQDPSGGWRPGYPPPGDPAAVTDPGDPASHPTGTPLPSPSPEPSPTGTVPPTLPPTPAVTEPPTGLPTGSPAPSLSLDVYTDRAEYRPGDPFRAGLRYDGSGTAWSIRQFLVLDVHGAFFFHPSWGGSLEWTERSVPPGELEEWFLEFPWPDGVGSDRGIRFWLAAMDPVSGELPGGFCFVEWGYAE